MTRRVEINRRYKSPKKMRKVKWRVWRVQSVCHFQDHIHGKWTCKWPRDIGDRSCSFLTINQLIWYIPIPCYWYVDQFQLVSSTTHRNLNLCFICVVLYGQIPDWTQRKRWDNMLQSTLLLFYRRFAHFCAKMSDWVSMYLVSISDSEALLLKKYSTSTILIKETRKIGR